MTTPRPLEPSDANLDAAGVEAAAEAIVDYEHEWNADPTCKNVAKAAITAYLSTASPKPVEGELDAALAALSPHTGGEDG